MGEDGWYWIGRREMDCSGAIGMAWLVGVITRLVGGTGVVAGLMPTKLVSSVLNNSIAFCV